METSENLPILEDRQPKNQRVTCRLVLSVCASVLGMLSFGYNSTVVNAPEEILQDFYNQTTFNKTGSYMSTAQFTLLWSLTVSIMALGGMFGGVSGAWFADKYGRKGGMLINSSLGILAALFMGISKATSAYTLLIIGRFVVGLHCGLSTGLSPTYTSEIAPYTIRGAIGTCNQLAVTIGILIGQTLGLGQLLGTPDLWPVLFAMTAVPSILQLIMFMFCPESPRFLLITKGNVEEASVALRLLRGRDDVDSEVQELIKEKEAQTGDKMTIWQVLTSSQLRLPLAIGVVMHLSQQLSGINGTIYYAVELFQEVGLNDDQAKYANLGIGGILVIMTLVSVPLMDRAGRRSLHLTGLLGVLIFGILFTICFHFATTTEVFWIEVMSIVFSLGLVVFFAIGPGSIAWLIVAELFAQDSRAAAVNFGVLINWFAQFLVGVTFPSLIYALDEYVFIPFSVLTFIFLVWLYIYLPETKGKTIDEITSMLQKNESGESSKRSTSETPLTYS